MPIGRVLPLDPLKEKNAMATALPLCKPWVPSRRYPQRRLPILRLLYRYTQLYFCSHLDHACLVLGSRSLVFCFCSLSQLLVRQITEDHELEQSASSLQVWHDACLPPLGEPKLGPPQAEGRVRGTFITTMMVGVVGVRQISWSMIL